MYTWYDAKYEWTYSTLTLFWALWLLWGLARLYQLQPWKDTAWRISGTFVHFWFFKPLHLINSNPTTASTCRFGSGLTVLWRDHWKFQWKIDHVTEMKEHSTWIPESPLGPRIVIQKCCCNVLKYHRWRCCVGGPEAVHPCVFARVLRWNCLLAEIFTQDSSTLQLSGQKLDEWAGTPTVSGKLLMDKILQLGWIQKTPVIQGIFAAENSGFCAYVLLAFLEMSCSLELPFCQGPYAKLQLESQREPLAPGSPLWSGIGGSHTCQHKTLEHPYVWPWVLVLHVWQRLWPGEAWAHSSRVLFW